jgi:hypothetical protein
MKSAAFVFILLAAVSLVRGQETERFSVSLSQAPLSELAKQLESSGRYRFYYNPSETDSILITVSAQNETLSEILTKAFANSELRFSIDNENNVFLLKGKTISFARQATRPDAPFIDTATRVVRAKRERGKTPEFTAAYENKLYSIGADNPSSGSSATLAGYILDDKTGEPLPGVSIFINSPRIGVASDQFGYYSLTLPKGRHTLNIQSMGRRDTRRIIEIVGSGKLDIELREQVLSLKEVVISATKAANVTSTQMGVERLAIKTIKQVPTVFGEADVLRVVLTLPGVKSVGEASTGFNVRGGAADQNLILFNDATIYNPAHFFGFFSAFNPEIVKDVELYKSSIPAHLGGRLSSVLEINSRDGNKKKISGSAGLGLLTSRFNIEGPLKKDKSSFLLGGRTTYANWMLGILPDEYKNSRASFQDINLHLNHEFDKKNSVYFTGYYSKDRFNLNSDTTYGYGNMNFNVKWKHIFNNKLNGWVSAGIDKYDYRVSSDEGKLNDFALTFDIKQLNLRTNLTYYLNAAHTIDVGFSGIRYMVNPGDFVGIGTQSAVIPKHVAAEHALESALYISDRFVVSPKISLNLGLRYSLFNYLGPQQVYQYAPGLPKTESTRTDSTDFKSGDFINSYHGPEIRVSGRYLVTPDFSVKAGYTTTRQYIHMMSNTTSIAPTDIWKLSDPNIRPQFGEQVSVGLYKNFKSNTIETSLEVYYKKITDYLDYRSGALLVMNDNIETDVLNTKGKAYGAELMIKKLTGKLNGWISYTYSRTLLRTDNPADGEIINKGEWYPSNYDKPHDVTMIGNYRFSHRFSVSLTATYSTGRPITLPIGRYFYGNSQRVLYSDRNAYRIPDYFRTDFSMNIEGNHRVKQKTHNSWTIGVYNFTGRKNPYSVFFVSEDGKLNGYKLSVFGSAIPFVNYNIRF